MSMMKFVEWPVVDKVPDRERILYVGQAYISPMAV